MLLITSILVLFINVSPLNISGQSGQIGRKQDAHLKKLGCFLLTSHSAS